MITERPPLAVIAGPTASGKSALAVALAERIGGVVVNADSAQIYRDLPILSAAPSEMDLQRAEHRLYGVLDGSVPCSAADWAALARTEIADIHNSGRTPVLVGGTGLYLRTLLDGIAPVPAIDPEVRKSVRSARVEDNRSKLAELDPIAAERIKANDVARTARALEVILSTGRTLQDWQAERTGGIGSQLDTRALVLLPPRDWLYERIEERVRQMIETGAVEEVRTLLERRLDPALPVMRAIGVTELARHLHGQSDQADAIAAMQQATRRYAKRQYTWFTHQPPPDWRRVCGPVDEGVVESAVQELSGGIGQVLHDRRQEKSA